MKHVLIIHFTANWHILVCIQGAGKQGSTFRPAETMETKVVQVVVCKEFKKMLINEVILSTCKKWQCVWSHNTQNKSWGKKITLNLTPCGRPANG